MTKQSKTADAPQEAAAEWVPMDAVKPWPGNPRKNEGEAVRRVAESIKRFGFAAPIVARKADGEIIAGHTRWKAARELKLDRIPVRFVDLDPADAHLLALADNRYTELTEWDKPALGAALSEFGLEDAAFAGWDSDGLSEIAGDLLGKDEPAEVIEDEVPEPPKVAVTKPGDVWILGDHLLVCGDCTDERVAAIMCDGVELDAWITDPPYGLGDSVSQKNKYDVYDDSSENLRRLVPAVTSVWLPRVKRAAITPGVANVGLYPRPSWIMAWFTPAGVGSTSWGFSCWQPILCYGKDPFLASGRGRRPDALVHTEGASSDKHPCAKPINLWKWVIERASVDGGAIVDTFGGSGTTISAAEQMGRVSRLSELSPNYCDVIVERWQNLTGGKAERRSAV